MFQKKKEFFVSILKIFNENVSNEKSFSHSVIKKYLNELAFNKPNIANEYIFTSNVNFNNKTNLQEESLTDLVIQEQEPSTQSDVSNQVNISSFDLMSSHTSTAQPTQESHSTKKKNKRIKKKNQSPPQQQDIYSSLAEFSSSERKSLLKEAVDLVLKDNELIQFASVFDQTTADPLSSKFIF